MNFALILVISALNFGPIKGQNGDNPSCFAEGECTESLKINEYFAEDAQECLDNCQRDEDCLYFTFYEDYDECIGFANCDSFLSDTCDNCYSGSTSCQDLQCFVFGACEASTIDHLITANSNDCLDACKQEESCQWFTYDDQSSECILLEDCQTLDTSCKTCISGQQLCSRRHTKMFVIGGSPGGSSFLSDVEVIDLANPASTCELVDYYPVKDGSMAVGLVDGLIKSCGGYHDTYQCFDYDPSIKSWRNSVDMLQPRYEPRGSIVDGLWLVSGGADTLTTDAWNGSAFVLGPELPSAMVRHCQLTVNSTHVFFADSVDEAAYLLDWERQAWTTLDTLYMTYRFSATCGKINNPENGTEIVIASDYTSDIFNLETQTWRQGPPVPFEEEAGSAQYFNTFVVAGGSSNEEVLDTIYIFDEINYDWKPLGHRLQVARQGYPGLVLVPDDFVNCA